MSTHHRSLFPKISIYGFIWFTIAATAACTNQSSSIPIDNGITHVAGDTLLNSERIRLQFGSYGVEVLYSDSTKRVTNLYSNDGGINVTRTFAVVLYPLAINSALAFEHSSILSGGSIGQVFKERGWTIEKQSMYLGQLSTSAKFVHIYELMGGIDSTELAIYLYSFTVIKDGKSYAYATIAEVYHPNYLTAEDLRIIYAAVDESISASDVTQKLDQVLRLMSIDLLHAKPVGQ